MLSLLLYEFRSRWSAFVILCSTLLIWDILLLWGFENFDILSLTLLYLTLIGFFVIYVIVNSFLFQADFASRHSFFVTLSPLKIWKIVVAKLLPIWTTFIVLTFIHSFFIFFTFLSVADRTNTDLSMTSFCLQLFKMNCFLFLLMSVSLLFFWMGILLVKILVQNSKAIMGLVVVIILGGSLLLLYSLRMILVGGFSNQSILDLSFGFLNPTSFSVLLLLTILLIWVNWNLLKYHIDQ